jgi:hypothetical protein
VKQHEATEKPKGLPERTKGSTRCEDRRADGGGEGEEYNKIVRSEHCDDAWRDMKSSDLCKKKKE